MNLYAWTLGGESVTSPVYTLSASPSVNDKVYDNSGNILTDIYVPEYFLTPYISAVNETTITLTGKQDIGFDLWNEIGDWTRDSSQDILDSSSEGTGGEGSGTNTGTTGGVKMNLYAWTNSEYNATFWTDVEDPTTESPLKIYDQNGNDVTSEYVHGVNFIISATATQIVYQYGSFSCIPIGVDTGV